MTNTDSYTKCLHAEIVDPLQLVLVRVRSELGVGQGLALAQVQALHPFEASHHRQERWEFSL